jgi:hypothetical protein
MLSESGKPTLRPSNSSSGQKPSPKNAVGGQRISQTVIPEDFCAVDLQFIVNWEQHNLVFDTMPNLTEKQNRSKKMLTLV